MPMPTSGEATSRSEAAREASRHNGAKSKGPKTAAGKRGAAKNAMRHGLRSPDTVAPRNLPDWVKRFETNMMSAVGHLGQRRREYLDLLLQVFVLIERADLLIVAEIGRLRECQGAQYGRKGEAASGKLDLSTLRKLIAYRGRFAAQRDNCIRKVVRHGPQDAPGPKGRKRRSGRKAAKSGDVAANLTANGEGPALA